MTRLGVIGKPSDWLIASNVDYKNVKDKFNIDLIDIDINELIDVYNSNIATKPKYFYELEHKTIIDILNAVFNN